MEFISSRVNLCLYLISKTLKGLSTSGSTWNLDWVLSPIEYIVTKSLDESEWMGEVCLGDLALSPMAIRDF